MSIWTEAITTPAVLFGGQPEGPSTRQTFTLTQNGNFTATDSQGSSFSFTVPVTVSGATAFTTSAFIGNSTVAVYQTRVWSGPAIVADVKLTLSVYDEYCQPAGVRLVITGTESWPTADTGAIHLVFGRAPLSVAPYRAYFGNSSGVAFGFDWNDSRALGPQFNAESRTLSWTVGDTFTIDPVTVATSTTIASVSPAYQTHLCYAAGRYWELYFDGANYGYVSSPDGVSWSVETTISTSGLKGVGEMAFACAGAAVYRAVIGPGGRNGLGWYYDSGTLGSNGAITWGQEAQIGSPDQYTVSGHENPAVAVGSNGNVWVAIYDYTTSKLEVWQGPATWSESLSLSSAKAPDLVPLESGKVALVYFNGPVSSAVLSARTWSGSSWSSTANATGSYSVGVYSATGEGDATKTCAYATGTSYGLTYLNFPYGGPWSSPTTLDTVKTANGCAMEADGSGNLVVIYEGGTTTQTVSFDESGDNGTTWSGPQTLVSSDPSIAGPIVGGPSAPELAMATWVEGSTSPYSLEFAAFSPVISTAATSTDPWSRPGLSPYESYFGSFDAFVSPGNGLLTVEQGTLDLPGRGLGLSLSLVYSMPYVFEGEAPLQYDNFTMAPVGLGWSLNLPWIGANYVHLSDGQAIPIAWTKGSVFDYHGTTDFELDRTSNTYTLYMKDGTTFYFYDNRQTDQTMALTEEVDANGNTISFSYANGRISNITDTVGRVVAFAYNAAGTLSTISSGGRAWTLGYSGGDLASITDPLGRATTYQYGTGINPWLVSAILFPTGGKLTYSYGNATVWGAAAKTYYATLMDTYYSPTQLSESQSVSYAIVNGKVVWANSTVSGSAGVVEHVDTNFLSSEHVSKAYYEDGTGALQRVVETDSDALGRTNETKLLSPTGTVLSTAVSFYDDWGNLVYSKDALGQQAWFSYANTDSANSFGSSGCSSSFYTQTVSAYIHDLIVGSCDYQDGSGSLQQEAYYSYDASGNLLEEKASHSGGWLYTDRAYDAHGNVLALTNPDGVTTYYRYSAAYGSAYLTKESALAGTQNVTTVYAYDFATGELVSQTDPNGYTTSYAYDALGRQTSVTYPAVNGVQASAHTYYYDNNNTMKTIDPDGHVAKAYFDGLARETETQQWNGTSAFSTAYYTYNWMDQVATKTTASGSTYYYGYDWAGRLVNLTNPDGTHELTSYNDVSNTRPSPTRTATRRCPPTTGARISSR